MKDIDILKLIASKTNNKSEADKWERLVSSIPPLRLVRLILFLLATTKHLQDKLESQD